MAKVIKTSFGKTSSILALNDYKCRTIMVEKGDPAKTGDILKAGTVYPANDQTALGIIMHDVVLKDDDNVATLMYQGTVSKEKLQALGVTVDDEAKKVMTRITII